MELNFHLLFPDPVICFFAAIWLAKVDRLEFLVNNLENSANDCVAISTDCVKIFLLLDIMMQHISKKYCHL